MFARFSLAILVAVVVAAGRPEAAGGTHDLVAVGARFEIPSEDGPGILTTLTVPTKEAIGAYRLLLRSEGRAALLQGSTVYAALPAGETATTPNGARIVEVVFYGRRSRTARSAVVFTDPSVTALSGAAETLALARTLAAVPPSVTTAAGRVLAAETGDDLVFGESLEILIASSPEAASSEALKVLALHGAEGTSLSTRRIQAAHRLKALGGARVYPDLFRRLAEDADPLVRAAVASE